jgi:hypothetical protein
MNREIMARLKSGTFVARSGERRYTAFRSLSSGSEEEGSCRSA